MRRVCIVDGCSNSDDMILCHNFPTSEQEARKWCESLQVYDLRLEEVIQKYVVCYMHFDRVDYVKATMNLLKPTAIPRLLGVNPRMRHEIIWEEVEKPPYLFLAPQYDDSSDEQADPEMVIVPRIDLPRLAFVDTADPFTLMDEYERLLGTLGEPPMPLAEIDFNHINIGNTSKEILLNENEIGEYRLNRPSPKSKSKKASPDGKENNPLSACTDSDIEILTTPDKVEEREEKERQRTSSRKRISCCKHESVQTGSSKPQIITKTESSSSDEKSTESNTIVLKQPSGDPIKSSPKETSMKASSAVKEPSMTTTRAASSPPRQPSMIMPSPSQDSPKAGILKVSSPPRQRSTTTPSPASASRRSTGRRASTPPRQPSMIMPSPSQVSPKTGILKASSPPRQRSITTPSSAHSNPKTADRRASSPPRQPSMIMPSPSQVSPKTGILKASSPPRQRSITTPSSAHDSPKTADRRASTPPRQPSMIMPSPSQVSPKAGILKASSPPRQRSMTTPNPASASRRSTGRRASTPPRQPSMIMPSPSQVSPKTGILKASSPPMQRSMTTPSPARGSPKTADRRASSPSRQPSMIVPSPSQASPKASVMKASSPPMQRSMITPSPARGSPKTADRRASPPPRQSSMVVPSPSQASPKAGMMKASNSPQQPKQTNTQGTNTDLSIPFQPRNTVVPSPKAVLKESNMNTSTLSRSDPMISKIKSKDNNMNQSTPPRPASANLPSPPKVTSNEKIMYVALPTPPAKMYKLGPKPSPKEADKKASSPPKQSKVITPSPSQSKSKENNMNTSSPPRPVKTIMPSPSRDTPRPDNGNRSSPIQNNIVLRSPTRPIQIQRSNNSNPMQVSIYPSAMHSSKPRSPSPPRPRSVPATLTVSDDYPFISDRLLASLQKNQLIEIIKGQSSKIEQLEDKLKAMNIAQEKFLAHVNEFRSAVFGVHI